MSEHELCFEGYISNFDGKGDNDGDGEPDRLRLPLFVIHSVERAPPLLESRRRPAKWMTVPSLAEQQLAPTDASYVFSQRFRARHAHWYERGALAPKFLAERIGADAAFQAHNLVNAVPQRPAFARSVWRDLECHVGAWANRYDRVWVIAGPVFTGGSPRQWLREPDRPALAVAIPDALFKIVLRKDDRGSWRWLAFLMPQQDPRYHGRPGSWNLLDWATSIAHIERQTQQTFLPTLDKAVELKGAKTNRLWPIERAEFDPPCRTFAGAN